MRKLLLLLNLLILVTTIKCQPVINMPKADYVYRAYIYTNEYIRLGNFIFISNEDSAWIENALGMWVCSLTELVSGGGSLDSSRLVTKYDLSQGNLNTNMQISNASGTGYFYLDNNTTSLVSKSLNYDYFIQARSDLNRVELQATNSNTPIGQYIMLDTTGAFYQRHHVVDSSLWIADKRYVDSLGGFNAHYLDGTFINDGIMMASEDYNFQFLMSPHYSVIGTSMQQSVGSPSHIDIIDSTKISLVTSGIDIVIDSNGIELFCDNAILTDNSLVTKAYVDGIIPGGGSVDISGTPVAGQLAVWTDANTIEGSYEFVIPDNTGWVIEGSGDASTVNFGGVESITQFGVATYYAFSFGVANYTIIESDSITKTISIAADSGVYIRDSLYLPYLNAVSRYGGLYIDTLTGAVKVDSMVLSASCALNDKLPKLGKLLRNRIGNEIECTYYMRDGVPVSTYDWNELTANERYAVIQAALEHNLRYTNELQVHVMFLWISIIILLVTIIYTRKK